MGADDKLYHSLSRKVLADVFSQEQVSAFFPSNWLKTNEKINE